MTSLETLSDTQSQPSADAVPLDSRVQRDVHNEENDPSLPDVLDPPDDWQFNIFLTRLAEDVCEAEFKKVKHLFTGIIGKKALQDCETLTDVFTIMRQRGYLNCGDILYLQSLVFHLNRRDLLEMCVDYARDTTNVIHFYSPPESAAENYKLVRFHVDGKDYSNCTRQYVQKLRKIVSRILFVPEQNITIAGVEPSSSMLITLMIPDMYADLLESMLREKANLNALVEMGIDVIGMGDTQYNIRVSEIEEAEIILTDQQAKLVNVYEQLRTKTKQLEELESECLKLSRKVKKYEDADLSKDAVLRTFQQMFNAVVPEKIQQPESSPASLKSQSALNTFRTALKVVEENGYDRNLIMVLLNANTTVSINRLREGVQHQCDDLLSQVVPLSIELEKYKFLMQVDPGELDELIVINLLRTVNVGIQTSIPITVHHINASKKASRLLRNKEKMKLKQAYRWPKDDRITEAIERDSSLFLTCLFLKEVQRTGASVDQVAFQTKCLEDVGRKDIAAKFQEWIKVSAPPSFGSKKQSKVKQTPVTPRESSKSRKENVQEQSQKGIEALSQQLKAVQDKVDAMHSIMESAKAKAPAYSTSYGDLYPFSASKRYSMRPPMKTEEQEDNI